MDRVALLTESFSTKKGRTDQLRVQSSTSRIQKIRSLFIKTPKATKILKLMDYVNLYDILHQLAPQYLYCIIFNLNMILHNNFLMLRNILPFLLLIILVASQSDCNPYGVRIQYGQLLINAKSTQKIQISFNTQSPCQDSFLRILGSKGFKDIRCTSVQVAGSANMNYFTTYVQRCPIHSQISFGETFYYNVFGYAAAESGDPVQGLDQMVNMNVIDPVGAINPTNILVLADWGVIRTTGFTPIFESLRNVMTNKSFKLMMINGDIAYNLDTNYGNNYMDFLKMAEEFISQIPVVFVPGNHENYTPDDQLLLNQTFIMYGIIDNLVTGFAFGDLYVLPFDPYRYLYSKNSTIDSLQALTSQLSIAKKTGLFIIPFSHYPLICSGESSNCQSILANMQNYFAAMIDAGVSLYMGAHSHEYQRIYPYNKDGSFSRFDPPYYSNGGYLVSIVEGVGGSDTDLVLEMPTVYDYTASYTVGETGFGVLTANQPDKVSWAHFSTKRQNFVDKMQIIKVQNKKKRWPFNLLRQ